MAQRMLEDFDMNEDYNEPADGPITLERVSHHLDCLAVDCEWRANEVWKFIRNIRADHDMLRAEVRAWRHNDDVHQCDSMTDRMSVKAHDRACEAAQRTDESGALNRQLEHNQ